MFTRRILYRIERKYVTVPMKAIMQKGRITLQKTEKEELGQGRDSWSG